MWWIQNEAKTQELKKQEKPLQIKKLLRRCRLCGTLTTTGGEICPRCRTAIDNRHEERRENQ